MDRLFSDATKFATLQAHRELEHLATQIDRAAKSCDAGAVHDVRVAIRRYTQALAICRNYFRSPETRKIRRRLQKIMKSAGEVRDYDVALKLSTKFIGTHATHLRAKLRTRRKAEAARLLPQLRRFKHRRISLQWRLRDGDSAEETVPQLARRTLHRKAKDFLKRGNQVSAAEDLHPFRITTKKFRYTIELLQPAYGTSLAGLLDRIKRVSTLLGAVNDCAAASRIVSGYKGSHRLIEHLEKRKHKKAAAFHKYWKDQFGKGDVLISAA
jgi:CHAD domain-containing protein